MVNLHPSCELTILGLLKLGLGWSIHSSRSRHATGAVGLHSSDLTYRRPTARYL
jgi:hypothetical protein